MIPSDALREVEERTRDLRARFSEPELRGFFADRSHDSLFAYVGEPVFWGRVNVPEHIVVATGFDIAVGNKYSVLEGE